VSENQKNHKSGFVNIVGSPNVGKSTLMNQLVGTKLSIITSKAQTTRHRIMGIVNDEEHQIVFSDTPGVLNPAYKLQEGMMNFVQSALVDADLMLIVTDVFEDELNNAETFEKLQKIDIPCLVLINKIDLIDQEKLEERSEYWASKFPKASILPISAMHKANTDMVMQWIKGKLPVGPAYYDKDALTDKPERFFVSEIIREKILINFKKEVPYSVEIEVEEFKETEKLIKIRAIIYVARDSQKGIIIGHQGDNLRRVGTQARVDIETFFDKKVYLELYVKVNKDWKSDERKLKRFGYLS
jgi:GTP-binding protein Era